jgi:signal transduction histidine kinase
MKSPLTLRQRILLTLLPLVILLAVLGGAGVLLLHSLGGSIDAILRENYESVVAMQDLKECLERIDSSFQFLLVARGLKNEKERKLLEEKARQAFEQNWQGYEAALRKEQDNITIHPREDELVEQLENLTRGYRKQGAAFYQRANQGGVWHQDYYGKEALYDRFNQITKVVDEILQLNQKEMVKASNQASQTASNSMIWLSVGVGLAVFLAGLLAWHTVRTILWPIQAMTQAAIGISAGNLDQVVPYPSGDELGQLAQAFNTMARHLRDIRQSQMSRLLRAQRTSQATIDSFPDPVLVVNLEGHVEMANPAAQRLLGVSAAKTNHAPWGVSVEKTTAPSPLAWQPPEALRQPLSAALQAQQPYLPEGFDRAVHLRIDDQDHVYLPRILPIRDPYGHTLGAAVLLQDVTRFQLLDEIKSNLVATVSHELKTPLTSVRLAIHLLLEETVGSLSPKQIELLIDARENAELLLARVDNLLDLTKLERGREQFDLRPESPADLLHGAADAIRPKAEDKGVEVVVEIPTDLPAVLADATRLGHALGNLLENAVTYTDRGGRITLSAAPGDPGVAIKIADTGIGIPPDHLPHVFDRFFRVPGRSRGSGSGLGLAIAREIITAHGGTIRCESRPGAGTVFEVTLPTVAGESDLAAGLARRASSPAK